MDLAVANRRGSRTLVVLLAGFAFLLSAFTYGVRPAHAETTLDTVAAALKDNPVYVAPDAKPTLSASQADALVSQIKGMRSGVPVFVAVLPDTPAFSSQTTLLQQLFNKVGKSGVYAANIGDTFSALDFSGTLRTGQARNLATAAANGGGDLATITSAFVTSTDAAIIADGRVKPKAKSNSNSGGGAGGVLIGIGVLVVAGGGAYLAVNSRKKKRAQAKRDAELAGLKRAVDEDITAYGEVLDALDFTPSDPRATDDMRRDYSKALDQYEAAKAAAAAAKQPADMKNVTEALEDGRFALATLDARRKGTPLPERRPPCFFDPRHGPSVGEVTWAPPGGASRPVPACAMDMTRMSQGYQPQVRQVETAYGPQPYYNAGPVYGPWAGGYFGGDVLSAVLIGTVMGSVFSGGFGGHDTYIENNYYGDGGGPDGGGGWGDGGGPGDGGSGDTGGDGGWGDFGGGTDWGGGDSGGGDGGGWGDGGGGDW